MELCEQIRQDTNVGMVERRSLHPPPCSHIGGWQHAVGAAELPLGRLDYSSVDRGRNARTRRRGRYSRGQGKGAAEEKPPRMPASPSRFRAALDHDTPINR